MCQAASPSITFPVNISVSAKDIRAGKRTSPEFCPIALATQRKLGAKTTVGSQDIYIYSNARRAKRYYVPPAVRKFIGDFDAGRPVKPFRFRISKKEYSL